MNTQNLITVQLNAVVNRKVTKQMCIAINNFIRDALLEKNFGKTKVQWIYWLNVKKIDE